MAYSFSRNEREKYETDLDKSINESLSGSQRGSDHEYLDLGFAWLSEYDKDGNFRRSDRQDTQNETEKSRSTQRRRQRRHRKETTADQEVVQCLSSGENLREFRTTILRKSGRDFDQMSSKRVKRHARMNRRRKVENNSLRNTNTNDQGKIIRDDIKDIEAGEFDSTIHADYGDYMTSIPSSVKSTKDRKMNQNKPRRSRRKKSAFSDYYGMNNMGASLHPRILPSDETAEENTPGWKDHGDTQIPSSHMTNINDADIVEENPYGWQALGATRIPTSHKPQIYSDENVGGNTYGWKALGATRIPVSHKNNIIDADIVEENPYGWKALGATRIPTSHKSNINDADIDEENPYDRKTLGATRIPTSHKTNINDADIVIENPYGRKTLGATRIPTSHKTNINDADIVEENPYGWKALGATRIETSHKTNTDENVGENPYGWKALGATQFYSSRSTEGWKVSDVSQTSRTHTQNEHAEEIVQENPYGLKALGRTRPKLIQSSVNEKRERSRTSRKRTFRQASLSRKRSHASEREPSSTVTYTERRLARAKRLSRLPEESSKNKVNLESIKEQPIDVNVVIRNTKGKIPAYSVTADGVDLRGTTYDYAYSQYINRESGDILLESIPEVQSESKHHHRESIQNIQRGSKRNQQQRFTRKTQQDSIQNSEQNSIHKENGSSEQVSIHPVTTNAHLPSRRKIHWGETRSNEQSIKHWTDLATDYITMRKWYEMFVKIKKRWAANYKDPSLLSGLSGSTGFRTGTIFSRSFDKRQQLSGRRRHAAICAIVFLVLLLAIVVPVSVLTSAEEPPAVKDKLMLYEIEVAINETYSANMSDNSTEEFRSIAQTFCNQIDVRGENVSNFNYKGCLVISLSNESATVIVLWKLVLAIEENSPNNSAIIDEFGVNEPNVLGSYIILKPTKIISINQISVKEIKPFKRSSFNETCSVGQSCRPVFSDCIDQKCMCPDNRTYVSTADACNLI